VAAHLTVYLSDAGVLFLGEFKRVFKVVIYSMGRFPAVSSDGKAAPQPAAVCRHLAQYVFVALQGMAQRPRRVPPQWWLKTSACSQILGRTMRLGGILKEMSAPWNIAAGRIKGYKANEIIGRQYV
jgi:hypothetical protein